MKEIKIRSNIPKLANESLILTPLVHIHIGVL